MSEDDKLAYLYYVAGCLREDKTPLPTFAWVRLYDEFKNQRRNNKCL